jgi:hypothetical protein
MNYLILTIGNIKNEQIEIVEQVNTEKINDDIVKGKSISLDKTPKIFFKPPDGQKTDLVRGAVSFPVISKRLMDIIKSSGDTNVEFHSTQMLAYGTDEIELDKTYSILNILHRVDCFDMEKSVYETDPEYPSVITKVKKIVLDSKKIEGRKIFRIKQKPSLIIIDKDLASKIEEAKLSGLELKNLSDLEF